MDWLSKVAKHHLEYVRVVESFGIKNYSEDIVQEMYLRVNKYCSPEKILLKDGSVNKNYIYFILRNLFLGYCNEQKKVSKVNIDDMNNLGVEYEYIEETEAFTSLIHRIDAEVETWHWYDRLLFDLYRESGKSIRKLSKETRISTSSIFQTLKYCKNQIVINVGEDYEDFINEDYELL